jgi:hypothetical protein
MQPLFKFSVDNPVSKEIKNRSKYLISNKFIEYFWPEYIPPYFYGKSIVFTPALRRKCIGKFHEYSNTTGAPEDSWLDIGLWSAFTYSKCMDPFRMEVIANFFHFQFWLDDQSENFWGDMHRDGAKAKKIYGQLVDVLDKLLGKENVSMIEWKPYILGHFICLDSVFSTFSPTQQKRCAELIKHYCYGNFDECLLYDGSVPIDNIESVIEVISSKRNKFFTNVLLF